MMLHPESLAEIPCPLLLLREEQFGLSYKALLMTTDEFPKDPEYWQNLEALGTPALMPNDEEVKLFQKYCAAGPVLLLGDTN